MSKPFYLTAGDLLPVFAGQLLNENGDPVPEVQTASSVVLSVQASGAPPALWSASMAFSVATDGASAAHVTHAWNASYGLPTAGFYQAQIVVTKPDGKTITVPNPGFHPIVVGSRIV